MNTIYDAAWHAYSALVERTRGKILESKPFAFWLEDQKRSGKYWGA